jgi:hypothetical protein
VYFLNLSFRVIFSLKIKQIAPSFMAQILSILLQINRIQSDINALILLTEEKYRTAAADLRVSGGNDFSAFAKVSRTKNL